MALVCARVEAGRLMPVRRFAETIWISTVLSLSCATTKATSGELQLHLCQQKERWLVCDIL